MPTLSARLVLRPKKLQRYCDDCGCMINEPHIVCFGMAERGDKPYSIRYCIRCANLLRGDKIKKLIQKFRRVVDAECVRAKRWRQIVVSLSTK